MTRSIGGRCNGSNAGSQAVLILLLTSFVHRITASPRPGPSILVTQACLKAAKAAVLTPLRHLFFKILMRSLQREGTTRSHPEHGR